MHISTFLKRVLLLDGASCLGMGAGLALLPIGLFIGGLGTRSAAPALLVYAVIAGNLLWTVESFLLIGSSPGISALGTAFVAAQAIAVAGWALLEWVGVRKSRAAAA